MLACCLRREREAYGEIVFAAVDVELMLDIRSDA